jgi:ubiquinone/menaquinone biosynthesis C-methylase UbiE
MTNKKQDATAFYFEIQSEMGTTKHLGGKGATDELMELCRIKPGAKILEVGCGPGITSRYLVKKHKVKITGIDINEKMVKKAKERSKGIDNLEFLVADAQNLPFKKNTFDIVFCQSVIAFVPDKKKAISEFKRVTKKGGFIGLNEGTWREAPPKKLERYFSRTIGDVKFLSAAGYMGLLEYTKLKNKVVRIKKIKMLTEMIENIKRFHLADYLRAWFVLIKGFFTSSKFRGFMWDSIKGAMIAKDIFKYWQYGLYVGQK